MAAEDAKMVSAVREKGVYRSGSVLSGGVCVRSQMDAG